MQPGVTQSRGENVELESVREIERLEKDTVE